MAELDLAWEQDQHQRRRGGTEVWGLEDARPVEENVDTAGNWRDTNADGNVRTHRCLNNKMTIDDGCADIAYQHPPESGRLSVRSPQDSVRHIRFPGISVLLGHSDMLWNYKKNPVRLEVVRDLSRNELED